MNQKLKTYYDMLNLDSTRLIHFGVKGMKWGVRKDRIGSGTLDTRTGEQFVKIQTRNNPDISQTELHAQHKDTIAVLRSIAYYLNSDAALEAHNIEIQKRLVNIKDPSSLDKKKAQALLSEAFSSMLTKHLEKAGVEGLTVKTYMDEDGNIFHYALGDEKTVSTYLKDIRKDKIAHADLNNAPLMTFTVEFLMNDDGTPNGFKMTDSKIFDVSLKHALDAVIVHFGIKGMKWGVRRSDKQLGRTQSGESVDGLRAKETLNTIQKTKTLSTVSNDDLNHLVNRLQLEKRFQEVNPSGFNRTHDRAIKALAVGKTLNQAISFYNSPGGQLIKNLLGLSKHSGDLTKPYGKHAKPLPFLEDVTKKQKKLNKLYKGK